MKRYTLLALIILSFLVASAQTISVKSFRALPTDMTASSLEGKRTDQNGDVAALIKVVTTEKGFSFEGGTLGIVDSKQEKGEVWVWIPRASRKITIKHADLGVLRDYMFPVEIEAERTYEMVLTTAKIETIVKEEVREQYLVFQITPKDAVLEVDDKIWPVNDGTARKFVKFGTYDYRVQAPNYYPDAGKATVDDPDKKCIVTVNLRPNYGWIEVKSASAQGADVYIDNALVGKAPCKSGNLASGPHTVRVVKEMYEPHIESVTVKDEATVTVAPTLRADFARVTLKVVGDAEIWVNDERKGVGSWTGNLATGTYRIECRKNSHEASSKTIEITNAMDGNTIDLPAPKPIYGSLNVESTPDFAKIFIDGKAMGETPNFLPEILIGQHTLKLTKDGYADYTETVTITKGERKQVNATLSNGREIQFTCNVPNAQLEVDGKPVGSASGTYLLTYGNHSLKATANDYQDYTSEINVTVNGIRGYTIKMKAIKGVPEGAINGVFSVSETKKVYFSQGNLQYQASTNTWRFAEHQWDCVGREGNKKASSSYNGWIDDYNWGTSGWSSGAICYQPWDRRGSNTYYYPGDSFLNDLSGSYAKADWGVYNAISNGGNQARLWRTLSKDEWSYVFSKRKTASGKRFARACVNGVNGVILLPDNWKSSKYRLKKTNAVDSDFNCNVISGTQWITLEQAGAVFLPIAIGSRIEFYWTTTHGGYTAAGGDYCEDGAYTIIIEKWDISLVAGCRFGEACVRLVCPIDVFDEANVNFNNIGGWQEGAKAQLDVKDTVDTLTYQETMYNNEKAQLEKKLKEIEKELQAKGDTSSLSKEAQRQAPKFGL